VLTLPSSGRAAGQQEGNKLAQYSHVVGAVPQCTDASVVPHMWRSPMPPASDLSAAVDTDLQLNNPHSVARSDGVLADSDSTPGSLGSHMRASAPPHHRDSGVDHAAVEGGVVPVKASKLFAQHRGKLPENSISSLDLPRARLPPGVEVDAPDVSAISGTLR